MRKISLVLATAAFVGSASIAAAQAPTTLQLGPGRDATQPGTITITAMGNQTRVVIDAQPGPDGATTPQPAHIHVGSCPGVGAVAFPLTNVVNGKSETTVNASWAQIQERQHSINIHRSPQQAAVYTACVNLPVAAQRAAPAQLPRTGGADLGLLAVLGAAFAGVGFSLRRR